MPFPSFPSGGRFPKPMVPIAMAVAGIGLAVVIVSQQQQMKQLEGQFQLSRQQVQQLEAETRQLEAQTQELSQEVEDRDARLKTLRNELASVATDRDRSRVSLEELQARVEELKEARSTMETQVSSVTRERDEARQRAQALEQEKSETVRSVLRLRERLALLDRDYRELTTQLARAQATPNPGVSAVSATGPMHQAAFASGQPATTALSPGTVELPPIVVRKDQAGMSIPVRGRIVEVNEPHRFIVVDKGSVDGVRVGMAFDIVRGGSTVGRATVVRVRPQLCACDILRARTPGPLQAGDQALQSGS